MWNSEYDNKVIKYHKTLKKKKINKIKFKKWVHS